MSDIENYLRNTIVKNMPNVPLLNTIDFDNKGNLTHKGNICFVYFFSPDCRYCPTFSLEYNDFIKEYSKKDIGIYAVDLSLNQDLIKMSENFSYRLGDVYPKILVYQLSKPCIIYEGVRSKNAMINFIEKNKNNLGCNL